MKRIAFLILGLLVSVPSMARNTVLVADGITLIPGSFEPGRGPDGNSVFIDAPEGLILVDTGRHAAHQDQLFAFAKAQGKPIAAIINTHWHLDHSGGNAEIRTAYPEAPLFASTAIEGALSGFFPESRKRAEAFLSSGKASAETEAEIRHDYRTMNDPASLRPSVPILASGTRRIAGRELSVHLAPFAATEGDVWLQDKSTGVVVAGDLVVAMVPFMDTACPEGWRKALNQVAATDFRVLIPGHGDPMTKAQFLDWRTAFNNLLDCAASDAAKETCIAGWKRDAAAFIPTGETRVDAMVDYYIDTRLRASPAERARYCPKASGQ